MKKNFYEKGKEIQIVYADGTDYKAHGSFWLYTSGGQWKSCRGFIAGAGKRCICSSYGGL